MIELAGKRVAVTGGAGFLGRPVCRLLERRGATVLVPRRADYALTREADAARMYADYRPEVVIHLAAEVGGIGATRARPGRFCYANLAMGLHLIEEARRRGLAKFVQVGTVCAYPKHAPVPFREESRWDGYPEETNAPYGSAKKALFVLLDAYQREYGLPSAVVVPVNLYGPGDNFDLDTSHVIPALIRKCLEAKAAGAPAVACWGTGRASREFLHVADAAAGVLAAAERMQAPLPVNLGTGSEIAIADLAALIARLTGYPGRLEWDPSKPDGQPRRRLDVSRAKALLDWEAKVELEQGLRETIEWYAGRG